MSDDVESANESARLTLEIWSRDVQTSGRERWWSRADERAKLDVGARGR